MKLKTMKKMCILMCVAVFSSALFAEGVESNQLVAQHSSKSRNNKNNNGQRNPNSWRPYYMKLKDAEPMMCSFYQQNVGVGFLYFSGISGNLQSVVGPFFLKTDRPLVGRLSYNRTPLFEAVIGRDIFRWLKIGLSYQHQGGIVVQTRPQVIETLPGNIANPTDLVSHVRLDAVMAKVYLMAPHVLVWKNIYHEPYLGLAVGPGWQTWTDIQTIGNFLTNLRQKISANCVFTVDLGFKLRKAMPNYMMSFTVGCKYNEWGQARSIGKISDQYISSTNDATTVANPQRSGFSNPLRVKTVYQFAPYIGVQFNF